MIAPHTENRTHAGVALDSETRTETRIMLKMIATMLPKMVAALLIPQPIMSAVKSMPKDTGGT